MSARPNPLEPGDQAHLARGSVRWHVARGIRIILDAGEQLHPNVDPFYVALLDGRDVVLTAGQVMAFVSPHDRIRLGLPDLSTSEQWLLHGGSDLSPVG
jgi:hypothetical protein